MLVHVGLSLLCRLSFGSNVLRIPVESNLPMSKSVGKQLAAARFGEAIRPLAFRRNPSQFASKVLKKLLDHTDLQSSAAIRHIRRNSLSVKTVIQSFCICDHDWFQGSWPSQQFSQL